MNCSLKYPLRLAPFLLARIFLAPVLLALALVWAFAANAQEDTTDPAAGTGAGAPISILPAAPLEEAADADPLAMPNEEPITLSQPAGAAFEPAEADEGAILSAPLSGLDPSSMGTLTVATGGFAPELWKNSTWRAIVPLVAVLPVNSGSPAARDLAFRLLLTEAPAPAGAEPGSIALLAARVERLYASGNVEGLAAFLDRLPPLVDDERIVKYRVDAAMLQGDVEAACAAANEANQRFDDLYWLRVLAFCRIQEGDADGAVFALDMLRDLGERDSVYFNLIQRLNAQGASTPTRPIGTVGSLTPLKLRMMQSAGIAPPLEMLEFSDPPVLNAIISTSLLPLRVRLAAAEHAMRRGAADAQLIAKLFESGAASPNDNGAGAGSSAGGPLDALMRLHFAGANASDDDTHLRYLAQALAVGREIGQFALISEVNKDAVAGIAPDTRRAANGGEIARALLITGHREAAQAWYELIRGLASDGDVQATTDLIGLWPLMQISENYAAVPWTAEILDLWWQAQAVHGRSDRSNRGTLIFASLEAMGRSIDAKYWQELIEIAGDRTYAMPSLAVLRGLQRASAREQVGETVLLALIALGSAGPQGANPAVLADVVQALRRVGLEREARALAVESLISQGL